MWAGGGVLAGSVGQQSLLGTRDSLPQGSLPPQGKGKEGLERKEREKQTFGRHLLPTNTVLGGSHMLPHESSQSFEITSVIIPILEMRKQRFKEVRTKILFGQHSGIVKYVHCLLS